MRIKPELIAYHDERVKLRDQIIEMIKREYGHDIYAMIARKWMQETNEIAEELTRLSKICHDNVIRKMKEENPLLTDEQAEEQSSAWIHARIKEYRNHPDRPV